MALEVDLLRHLSLTEIKIKLIILLTEFLAIFQKIPVKIPLTNTEHYISLFIQKLIF